MVTNPEGVSEITKETHDIPSGLSFLTSRFYNLFTAFGVELRKVS